MAGYIGSKASVVSSGAERKKTFTITGATTSLTGLNYTVGKVHVFQNGVRLLDGTDYTATNGTSITLTVAAQSGDNVVVVSQASFQLSEHYTSAEADAEFVNDPSSVITVSGSNVGIGTSSPSRQLEIYDDGTVGQAVLALTAQNTDPSRIMFADPDDVNIGILDYHHSDNSMRFIVNNAERMRLDSSGNVGIGTSSPNNYSVNHKSITLNAPTTPLIDLEVNGTRTGSLVANSTNVDLNAVTSVPIRFLTADTERMRIDASGRVTKPNQPYFCVHSPGQSNITVGSYTTITLNQEEVDTGNNFANNTFTAPVTGVYSLTLLVRLDDVMANSSYYNTSINTSNRSYPLLFSPNGFDANVNYWQFTINVIADMDAGDTASCNVGQIGGSLGTDINNSTRFMGYLLG